MNEWKVFNATCGCLFKSVICTLMLNNWEGLCYVTHIHSHNKSDKAMKH